MQLQQRPLHMLLLLLLNVGKHGAGSNTLLLLKRLLSPILRSGPRYNTQRRLPRECVNPPYQHTKSGQ